MLVLLSPAKSMNTDRTTALPLSRPRFGPDTDGLVSVMRDMPRNGLQGLMKLSDTLTDLNVGRYRNFADQDERPAALLYDGDVYAGLDAASLDEDGLKAADESLRILSGLYGLLRPLDAIRPHRMEMGTRLETDRGRNLYGYWGTRIADALREDLAGRDEEAVLNLASVEYAKSVDRDALDRPVVEVTFLNRRDGEARNIAFHSKRARGMMARYVVDNRIDRTEGVRGFDYGGYALDEARTEPGHLVFTREQPEPKGGR